ncbi:MAG: GAF domain-containing protein [Sphingopyxis sp.]
MTSVMNSFAFTDADPTQLWHELADAADAITAGESDAIANMANVAALLWQALPGINWAGFYRFNGTELVLGPFQGKSACIRISLDRGVCGAAARTRTTQRIADVHAFDGHIACDDQSRSELVVPIIIDGQLIGVLDLDSPTPDRFTLDDANGAEELLARIGSRLSPHS